MFAHQRYLTNNISFGSSIHILTVHIICTNRNRQFFLTGKEHDFVVQTKDYLTTLGAPYDYGSIMHYGTDVFSKDGTQPTITPKYDPNGELGQRGGFSPLDIWKINKLYGCNTGTKIIVYIILHCSFPLVSIACQISYQTCMGYNRGLFNAKCNFISYMNHDA